MSAAEIADNKWELTATKPPVTTVAGIAQITLMGCFGLFFLWIVGASAIAIVTPSKGGGLAQQYTDMKTEGTPAQ